MNFLDDLKNKAIAELGLPKAVFSYPPDKKLGDLSLACFEPAKAQGKNPAEFAASLAAAQTEKNELKKYFSQIAAVGPYLNFFINPAYLSAGVIDEIKKQKNKYGLNFYGRKRKVMIEYSNGNTHKEYHVGHLRNISYGDAINRLLAANGYISIPVSYINDFGIHAAKTLWNWERDLQYRKSGEPKGYLLGRCYAAASRVLENNQPGGAEVGEIMKEIESRAGKYYDLWKETRQWSISYFASIYQELGIKFKKIFYESEVVDRGLKIVEELKQKNILTKSAGAIIADLTKYDLGVLPIIRSNGTALYPVADISLALIKFEQYKLDESIYVVDVRQRLYFKQLFKILELGGDTHKRKQLAYDFVTLPDGMMSSRTGNIITYEELKNKILDKLTAETKARHADWTDARIGQVALSLTISTIKFEMLKVGAEKTITFDIEESLRFDGYTACYLQYSYARLKSIIRKEGLGLIFSRLESDKLTEPEEKELLLKLAKYPETVAASAREYDPSELAKYLFELAHLSNDYYQAVNILKAPPAKKKARLALIKAVAQVLNNGFNLLGLNVLEEM